MIGKRIESFRFTTESETCGEQPCEYGETTRNDYFIQTLDGMQFPIELWHQSNGYYSGSIGVTWCDCLSPDIKPKDGTEIVFIVGLPGSGKSTFANNHYSDYEILDDDEFCLNGSPHISGQFSKKVTSFLQESKSLCFVSAHFTSTKFYHAVFSLFPWNLKRLVKTICFENDPQECIKNVIKRDNPTMALLKKNDISRMTSIYIPGSLLYRNVSKKNVFREQ